MIEKQINNKISYIKILKNQKQIEQNNQTISELAMLKDELNKQLNINYEQVKLYQNKIDDIVEKEFVIEKYLRSKDKNYYKIASYGMVMTLLFNKCIIEKDIPFLNYSLGILSIITIITYEYLNHLYNQAISIPNVDFDNYEEILKNKSNLLLSTMDINENNAKIRIKINDIIKKINEIEQRNTLLTSESKSLYKKTSFHKEKIFTNKVKYKSLKK